MRYKQLDGLRGIAATIVVLYHFLYQYPVRYDDNVIDFAYFGIYGVQLFFILSGFVIFISVDNKDRMGFFKSRVLRLYPVYWLGCFYTFFILSFGTVNVPQNVSQLLINLTMLQSFFGVEHIDGTYWTLTYEILFYLYAITLFKSKKFRFEKLTAILTFQLIYVFIKSIELNFPRFAEAIFILQFMHYFCMGMCLYLLKNYFINIKQALFLVLMALINNYLAYGFANSVVVASVYIVFVFCVYDKLKFFECKALCFLGGISYALYISHQYVGYEIMHIIQSDISNIYISTFLTLIYSIIIAQMIKYLSELPTNFYKKKVKVRC
ncbi:TPA: acyltransferase family protein [Vibrio parahaemolyticus]|uniref:acyltransferase family protein n=1 Tax=Vibrio parahaemolyticus TaxID=670 RepID=UPI000419EB37|nr:acyltransferase [Vibrio parahaemolyticus]EGQ9052477.1 hypothetical protein [Vibrio parahaemolyticus]HAS6461893.1 acyltransferase family protein [Vibrio parahaemolyticus]HAS6910200.1 acyltransferase family protein [Vibrio parahaemolyticus]HAS6920493.1 acyltransferase family protein [Vibrio parahaemolyticus]